MENQNYKGVDIFYNETKKLFFTKVLLGKDTFSSKKMDVIKSLIDKTLSAFDKKNNPPIKRAWMKGPHDDAKYKLVDIIWNDEKQNTVTVRNYLGRIMTIPLSNYKYNKHKIFFSNKRNDKIVEFLEKQQVEIELLKKKKKTLK